MRVGINLLYLLPGVVGGTETYAAGLLHSLANVGNNIEFVVFVNRESANWPIPQAANIARVICPVAATNRGRRYLFEQFFLPRMLKKYEVDIIHSLGYVGPLWTPCPAVVTVPDLNFLFVANNMSLVKRHVLQFFSVHAAKRANAVITISNNSKDAICNRLKIHPGKVAVTLLGPRWEGEFVSQDAVNKIEANYGILGPYLVAFGGGSVHKNIPRLLQAFTIINKHLSFQLILIGHLPPDVNPGDLPEGVMAIGYVPAEHILPLLSKAQIFVLPSLYEGFGLPILEAQQVGVPVVCSTAGSLPEVAGEAAAFFNPYSISDMADKMALVLESPSLRTELRLKGLANVRRFSWGQTGRETLAVYEKVAQGH